jgi:hypothetical protein
MIVAEKKAVTAVSCNVLEKNGFERFGELMSDGRLSEKSDNKVYRLREAIIFSRQLGRPLSESEMKRFVVE